ncbi:MAG: hypothetical protein KF832_04105 [Caldilineaceae bacterium]|nr:hypothetical protein [Caldilineaceae bacterium]
MSKSLIKALVVLLLLGGLLQPLRSHASTQSVLETQLSAFEAILTPPGIAIQWQVTGASLDWGFTLYRSQNCQLEGATEVVAPIFSSVNDEAHIAHYTLTDTGDLMATCAYWLVATETTGAVQQFGPYQIKGRSVIYLPIAVQ